MDQHHDSDDRSPLDPDEYFEGHVHYWGIPHPRPGVDHLVQTCLQCGAERELRRADPTGRNGPGNATGPCGDVTA